MNENKISKLQEKLSAARTRENEASAKLAQAAVAFTLTESRGASWDALTAAAKKWTNAMHQRSRCEKHLKEAQS